MVSFTLKHQWAMHFERKIVSEFNLSLDKIENYSTRISPLIYCCLSHRRVKVKKWNIKTSNEFESSEWVNNKKWLKIKNKLENGYDINHFMSKKLVDWMSVDYLLYTYNIYHFHLDKDNSGGIGEHLVFGVFYKDTFYVLGIENHNDLYSARKWIQTIYNNWNNLDNLFQFKLKDSGITSFDPKELKKIANNPNLQFNLVEPIDILNEDGQSLSLIGHQHTNLTNVDLGYIKFEKIPIQAFIAFSNEENDILNIESEILSKYRNNYHLNLTIDEKNFRYKIIINKNFFNTEIYNISKNKITCSHYHKYTIK